MKVNKKLIILMIAFFSILIMPIKSHAGLQANKGGTTLVNTSADTFFKAIRAMESEYGTLGKKATIGADYTDTSGNGIDCHMAKNTEYGTITLLAASGYGNKPADANASTTGNASGIYEMTKELWVANVFQKSSTDTTLLVSAGNSSYNQSLRTANTKYVDKYIGTSKQSIPGDGIFDTDNWGGSSNMYGDAVGGYRVFLRAIGGMFGYHVGDTGSSSTYIANGGPRSSTGARAIVFCGQGL